MNKLIDSVFHFISHFGLGRLSRRDFANYLLSDSSSTLAEELPLLTLRKRELSLTSLFFSFSKSAIFPFKKSTFSRHSAESNSRCCPISSKADSKVVFANRASSRETEEMILLSNKIMSADAQSKQVCRG